MIIILAGCSNTQRYVNTRYEENDDNRANRASIKTFRATTCLDSEQKVVDGCELKKDEIFIGVAISGGGSRAANYSAAVLRELDSIGILQNVDVISSVSGGSLTSAYLAAKGKRFEQNTPEFWENAKKDLSQDFRSKLLLKLARPDNLITSMFGTLGRTELMAQVFDENIFNGLTFGDMGSDGFGLLINATTLNELPMSRAQWCASRGAFAPRIKWESIAFTDFFFKACLNSNINNYPLSRAVAASAAFPGLFSAVPLAAYPSEVAVQNFGVEKSAQGFLHVMDGGASDNLGVESLAANLLYHEMSNRSKVKQCLLIVIDAFASGENDRRHKTDDLRSSLDRLVDSNFFDSIDAMLSHRREATLRNLGQARLISSENGNVENFPVDGVNFALKHKSRTSTTSLRKVMGLEREFYSEDVDCFVWYLSIDGLDELVGANWEFGEQRREKTLRRFKLQYTANELEQLGKTPEYQPDALRSAYMKTEYPHRVMAVRDLATRVKTDFNLVGPKNCSSSVLSRALWLAGTISVNADILGRTEVCKWIRARGFGVSEMCESDELHQLPKLPVKYLVTEDGDYSVVCQ